MKLFQTLGVPFATLAYSATVYGAHNRQHALIDRLLARVPAARHHRQWVFDDFLTSPLLKLEPPRGVATLAAAETPVSVFASLPIILAHRLRHTVLAHERSADTGQFHWEVTGEDVNHQWGKSLEAEILLNDYIQEHLVPEFTYFSILKPIHDPVIFNRLRRFGDDVAFTHSCNVDKPWCGRCAKCAYVFLNYAAYLPREVVERTFPRNLLDVPGNAGVFRQLCGLESRLPFECVGAAEESRLAAAVCVRKGYAGTAALAACAAVTGTPPEPASYEKYLAVDATNHNIPAAIRTAVLDQMRDDADDARTYLKAALG
jgi:hypothetical protein